MANRVNLAESLVPGPLHDSPLPILEAGVCIEAVLVTSDYGDPDSNPGRTLRGLQEPFKSLRFGGSLMVSIIV